MDVWRSPTFRAWVLLGTRTRSKRILHSGAAQPAIPKRARALHAGELLYEALRGVRFIAVSAAVLLVMGQLARHGRRSNLRARVSRIDRHAVRSGRCVLRSTRPKPFATWARRN